MKRLGWSVLIVLLATGAGAFPRTVVPGVFRVGAINEVYVWDEASVGTFSVEVRRPGAAKPFLTAPGFAMEGTSPVTAEGRPPGKWAAALVALDLGTPSAPVVVRVVGADRSLWSEVTVEVQVPSYPEETIVLDGTMSDLRAKPDARKDRESAEIARIYATFRPEARVFSGRFRLPVDPGSASSGAFGDVRRYQYSDGTQATDLHRGTDFGVPTGTPVASPAPGTVVLAVQRMLTGLTVVIEHAPGLYSTYFHLSKIAVKKGQRLQAGDRLGLSGATGLVTGPHLHWEVRVNGVPVDPLSLVSEGLLDIGRIAGVFSSIERPKL